MTEKIICYYHKSDMDGISSAAVVFNYYIGENDIDIEFVGCDYGEQIHVSDLKNDTVIVVDFSFHKDIMELLNTNSKKFIWIDHHKTAKDEMPDLWNKEGKCSLEKAACVLTWETLFPTVPVPQVIDYLGDYDLWKFEFGNKTRQLQEIIWLWILTDEYKNSPYANPLWKELLAKNLSQPLLDQGQILLDAKHKRCEKTFDDGFDGTLFSHKTRFMNSNNDISDAGAYAVSQGYDIGCIYSIKKDLVIFSLRSKEVDVSIVAKSFGGGGHKLAAGFSFKKSFKGHEVLKWLSKSK